MDLHPDFRDLLAEFVRCDVSFAVLGGYAQDLADVALLERVRDRQAP